MKEWSILIKVQAATKEDACEAAATFLNNGGTPDIVIEGDYTIKCGECDRPINVYSPHCSQVHVMNC